MKSRSGPVTPVRPKVNKQERGAAGLATDARKSGGTRSCPEAAKMTVSTLDSSTVGVGDPVKLRVRGAALLLTAGGRLVGRGDEPQAEVLKACVSKGLRYVGEVLPRSASKVTAELHVQE